MLDVIAFVLRALVVRFTPGLRPLLVLDEPFKHVSVGYRKNVARVLKATAELVGVSVLMVTHEPEYATVADRCYLLQLENGMTVGREVDAAEAERFLRQEVA